MKCRKSTKTTPGAPKNDLKTTPRRPKKRPRTTRRQENRTKTISRPSWTPPSGRSTAICAPLGVHFGGQIGTKTEPKTIQNRSEKSRGKKTDPRRSWTRLGSILGRLGPPSWVKKRLKPFILNGYVKKNTFSKIRRFEDGSGTNLGRKRRQHDRK